MAFLVIFGSATFAQVLAFTGASSGLMDWAIGFQVTPLGMLFIMIGVIIFLGSFMDPLSKMLLTAPIFFPLAKTLGFDLTWFGLIMLLALEMGYTMPPFGLLLFVMKGVSPPGTTHARHLPRRAAFHRLRGAADRAGHRIFRRSRPGCRSVSR